MRQYVPVSDEVIRWHLRGKDADMKNFVMGIYPMEADETIRVAVIDFDESSWRRDAILTVRKARVRQILTEDGKVTGVRTYKGSFSASWVILATGGLSYPTTGSTGDGYRMAESLGHTVTHLRQWENRAGNGKTGQLPCAAPRAAPAGGTGTGTARPQELPCRPVLPKPGPHPDS